MGVAVSSRLRGAVLLLLAVQATPFPGTHMLRPRAGWTGHTLSLLPNTHALATHPTQQLRPAGRQVPVSGRQAGVRWSSSSSPTDISSPELSALEKEIVEKTNAKLALERELNDLMAKKRRLQGTVVPSPIQDDTRIVIETPLRSLVKACSWRFVAALITLSTSLFFSRNAAVAASIVSSDFLSKAGTMYVGERVWNKVNWGKDKKGDTARRSVMKALAWRLFAMVNTLVVSLFFAKDMKTAGKIASVDTIIKTTLYVFHERLWSKIEWGRRYEVEYNI